MADTAHPKLLASAQVVSNTDLLYAIFTFVPLASSNRDSYLASCVCTSHTLYEPALRVLWRNLDSLLPLWHLLAPSNTPFPDYEDKFSSRDDTRILAYLQSVNSAKLYRDSARWRRSVFHAGHVRGITHRSSGTYTINDTNGLLIRAVITQNGGTAILPLLRTIGLLHPVDLSLTPFFTSTLRRAALTFGGSTEVESVSSLRTLRNASPFLEKIDLYSGFGPDEATSGIRPVLIRTFRY